jgi:hypothetical protein
MSTDQQDVRKKLSKLRKDQELPPVSDATWKSRRIQDRVSEFLIYRCDLEDLSRDCDVFMEIEKEISARDRSPRANINPTAKDYGYLALAAINSIEAARHPGIVAFRSTQLGGLLLEPKQVSDWLTRKAEATPRTICVEVQVPVTSLAIDRLPTVADLRDALHDLPGDEILGMRRETLKYSVPGNRWPRTRIISTRSTLHELKQVAAGLTALYGWQEGDAVVFILTGQPIIPPIAQFWVDAGTKAITIKVDPRCALRRLEERYTEVRKQALGRERDQRCKPITSAGAMELAVFAAEQHPGTWQERMAAWNKGHKKRYKTYRTFRRDTRISYYRVTGRQMGPS